MSRWTPENIRRAQAILGEHLFLDEGIAAVSAALGFSVTRAALDCAFAREGLPTPHQCLKKRDKAIPPVDARDTIRMEVAPAFELPDDSGTTAEQAPPEPPTPAAELLAHRQRNRIAELEARTKRLLEELAKKDEELAAFKDISRPPRPIVAPRMTPDSVQRKGVAVMLCSDWHVGEFVNPATVNGLNEYDPQIAARCIDRLADGFVERLRDSGYDCRTAVIALMGDLMTGYLHDELVESNALSPVGEQVFLLDHLELMLRKILALTELELVVPCLSGNHGRMTEKQRVSTREENSHEQVVYQTLKRLFRDEPRIEFQIAAGEWLELDVMGFTHCFTHGDSFRSNGGVGGISIPIQRGVTRQFQGRDIHQVCMGHFHQRKDFGNIQVNGSLIGYSAYSMHIHAAPERRQQHWFMVDSEKGKDLTAPIWL
ncbi:MAG TPA: hypothetical protein VM493_05985 [Vicinamibacterales bacterium]|nr:hypothetical protein [Vicinamibacterales bacterium]